MKIFKAIGSDYIMTNNTIKTTLGIHYKLNGNQHFNLSSIRDYNKEILRVLLSLRGVNRGSEGVLYFKDDPNTSLEYKVSNEKYMGLGNTVEINLVETQTYKSKTKESKNGSKLEEAVTNLISSIGLPQALSEVVDYNLIHDLIERNGGEVSHAIRVFAGKSIISVRPKSK